MTARYWRHPDGRVVHREVTVRGDAHVEVPAPSGAEEISTDEGQRALEELARAAAEQRDRARAEAAQAAAADYRALVGLGVPARLAARLTGHRPHAARPAAGD